jgi:hypothetical protein
MQRFISEIVGTKDYRKPEWVSHMEEMQEALKGNVPDIIRNEIEFLTGCFYLQQIKYLIVLRTLIYTLDYTLNSKSSCLDFWFELKICSNLMLAIIINAYSCLRYAIVCD